MTRYLSCQECKMCCFRRFTQASWTGERCFPFIWHPKTKLEAQYLHSLQWRPAVYTLCIKRYNLLNVTGKIHWTQSQNLPSHRKSAMLIQTPDVWSKRMWSALFIELGACRTKKSWWWKCETVKCYNLTWFWTVKFKFKFSADTYAKKRDSYLVLTNKNHAIA